MLNEPYEKWRSHLDALRAPRPKRRKCAGCEAEVDDYDPFDNDLLFSPPWCDRCVQKFVAVHAYFKESWKSN